MPGARPAVGSSPSPPGCDPDTWHGAASWHSPVSCSMPVGTQGLGPFCSGWLQPQLVPFKSATRGEGGGNRGFLSPGCPPLYLPAWRAARSSSLLPAHIWRGRVPCPGLAALPGHPKRAQLLLHRPCFVLSGRVQPWDHPQRACNRREWGRPALPAWGCFAGLKGMGHRATRHVLRTKTGPGPAAPGGSFTLSFSWHPHTNITENLPGPGRPAALRCCSRRLTPYQQLKRALIKALGAPPVGTQRGQATPAQPQERRSSHTDAKKKKGLCCGDV